MLRVAATPEDWGRPLLIQMNSGVIAELRVFHFTCIYFSSNLGTKDLLDLNLGELPVCPSSHSPQRQTPPRMDIFNKQSLSHEAVEEKYLAVLPGTDKPYFLGLSLLNEKAIILTFRIKEKSIKNKYSALLH